MIITKVTACQLHTPKHPRYHDRVVLLVPERVGHHNKIIFTQAKSQTGREYYISGRDVHMCPMDQSQGYPRYAVPMHMLEPLEYAEDIKEVALSLFDH
jgi:hypothetical protein